jgi:tripartite-type tricarboxylate transporter receptor subunit TctC
MVMNIRAALPAAFAAAFTLVLPVGAQEAGFPSRPIRVVVPFTPGTLDVLARSVGQKINDKYGHPVVVDNRPGAATIVGSEIVSKARPDGYTLLMITTTFTINPTLYSKLPYNPQRDFTPITQFDNVFNILVVAANSPLASVADLIAQAKGKPGALTHASAGVGTAPHIATELLKMTAGIDMTHVPFKGIPEAGTEVMTGRITTLMTTTASASPFLKSGRLKALGVSSAKRLAALPDVPTIAETLPGFQATAFRGLVGPGGVPPAIVRQLATDIAAILRMPDVRDRLLADGGEPVGSTPEEFRTFLGAETEKWGKVIRSAGLKAD